MIRMVTYNIHGWRTLNRQCNVEAVAELLAETGADVIGLNEVFHPHSTELSAESALAYLARDLQMFYAYSACGCSTYWDDAPLRGFGNALLSRWPIQGVTSNLFTPIPGKQNRGILVGRVQPNESHTLTVGVTHLDHTDEDVRLAQFQDLVALMRTADGQLDVFMGDFNAVHPMDYEHRPAILSQLAHHPIGGHLNPPQGPRVISRIERSGYVDAFAHLGLWEQGTFPRAEHPVRFDYIWLKEDLVPTLRKAGVWEEADEDPSDHLPVFVDLDWP